MIRVGMLANWCDSRTLCDLFNRMTTDGRSIWSFRDAAGSPQAIRMTWDDEDPDFWVVINAPPPGFDHLDPSRTVVFQMEPVMWSERMRGRWGSWAAPSPLSFVQVRDHRRYRNSCDWWLGLSYEELAAGELPPKERQMAACVSEKYSDPGQIKRLDFLHFLDATDLDFDLDIYGSEDNHFRRWRSRTPAHDKRKALLPYRYAFDAENHSVPNFYTEKIVDCILAETLCFYWGCPNLDSFFDPRAFIRLELDDFAADLARIREAIANDEWSRRLPYIRAEKERILETFQFFPTLARVVDPQRRREHWHVSDADRALVRDLIGDVRARRFVEISDRTGAPEVSETIDVERRLDWTGVCLERDLDRSHAARAIRDAIVVVDDKTSVADTLQRNGSAPHSVEWLNLAVESPSQLLRGRAGATPTLDMSHVRANLISMPRASTEERAACVELLTPFGYEATDTGDALVRRGRDDIFGFYHLCTINNWREVLSEQLAVWNASGLAGATTRVHASVVGPAADEGMAVLSDALGDGVEFVSCGEDASAFERPILEYARVFCEHEGSLARAVWYMHAKGVSPEQYANPAVTDWRRFMQHFVVDGWRQCADAVRDNDLCGVNWHREPRPHFSGNFWWASPRYVATLPLSIGPEHFDAEAWIGTNQPRVRCLAESGRDHYLERYPPHRYLETAAEHPTICLNMIVKNEAHIVHEVLDDVVDRIDTWVIVDTGSDDGTPDVIRSYFEARGIPGELHERPWRDFATNRSAAIELCNGKADYAWVIDADDRVVGDLDLTTLDEDSYLLRYGDDFTYWRKQIFRLGLPWRFEGPVHEYAVCSTPCSEAKLGGEYHVESRRLGDRSRSSTTYARDAAVLRAALVENPDDARSMFYLAQSLRDAGDERAALECYERRCDMFGWDEETFIARLERARLFERLDEPWETVLNAYLEAWQSRPSRAEPLYEIARWYRTHDQFELGYLFASRATEIEQPDDGLFVSSDVYRWRAVDERAICAFYTQRRRESFDLGVQLLANPALPESERDRIMANRDLAAGEVLEKTATYPEAIVAEVVARIKATTADPEVTLTITTCRRLQLFETTMNSFLNCCADLDRIGRFICIDDGSSAEDRARMRELYPFFEFIDKSSEDAGHASSMERLRAGVASRYWLHLEDDWHFFVRDNSVGKTIEILEHDPQLAQVLYNRNYGETLACRRLVGGSVRHAPSGTRYRVHEHLPHGSVELATLIDQLAPDELTNAWWPHFSLRPSLMRTSAIAALGPFDSGAGHFELDMAGRYAAAGHRSAFFDEIRCIHIGRRTFDRGPDAPANAYDLNELPQFEGAMDLAAPDIRVLNLDRRPDRWRTFVEAARPVAGDAFVDRCQRVAAVDGSSLTLTPEVRHQFRGNDFGFRRGIVGCALSHLGLWRDAASSRRSMLVFEDDARLSDDFLSQLAEARRRIATEHPGVHLLLLGCQLYSGEKPTERALDLEEVDWDDYLGGLYAYVISPAGARRLLAVAHRDGIGWGIDRFVQHASSELDVLRCVPPIVTSPLALTGSDGDSDIQHDFEPVGESRATGSAGTFRS